MVCLSIDFVQFGNLPRCPFNEGLPTHTWILLWLAKFLPEIALAPRSSVFPLGGLLTRFGWTSAATMRGPRGEIHDFRRSVLPELGETFFPQSSQGDRSQQSLGVLSSQEFDLSYS